MPPRLFPPAPPVASGAPRGSSEVPLLSADPAYLLSYLVVYLLPCLLVYLVVHLLAFPLLTKAGVSLFSMWASNEEVIPGGFFNARK